MIDKTFHLIGGEGGVKELAHSGNHTPEVLFHVFVEYEENVGMVLYCPGLLYVRKEGSLHDLVLHEPLCKAGQVPNVSMASDEFVVVVVADQHVLGVSHHINHLGLGHQVGRQEGEREVRLDESSLFSRNVVQRLLEIVISKPGRWPPDAEGAPPPEELEN